MNRLDSKWYMHKITIDINVDDNYSISLHLLREHQGLGIGKTLFNAVIELLKNKGL